MSNGSTKLEKAKSIEEIAGVMYTYNEIARDAEWDVKSVLKDMYKDPSHFVFELIQNAEDTHATKVKMVLEKDKFLFMHNGKNFTLNDIKGVCKAGGSAKTSDQKGKFGIGFKAVYKITNTPKIYCSTYNFKIEEYNVPSVISSYNGAEYDTIIELPFDTGENLNVIYNVVEKGLKELNQSSIMFLDFITEIEVKIDDKQIYLRKSYSNTKDFGKVVYNQLTTVVDSITKKYHLFTSKIQVEVKNEDETESIEKNISIAYPILEQDDEPEASTKLSVYFPTEQETFLKFLIDAPFDTTPTREQVDVQTTNNQKIMDSVLSLYEDTILIFKRMNFLNLDIIYLLAINSANSSNEIYGNFFEITQEVFNTNDLLPKYNGGYVKATESLLCRSNRDFIDVLSEEDLKEVFDDRYQWIDGTGIRTDRSDELRAFLTKSLGIVDVEFNTFMPKTTPDFFESKSDEWLMSFYRICKNNIENIKNNPKKIIRTQDGRMNSPFIGTRDKAVPDVFLPSSYVRNTEKVIKDSFLHDENSMNFFKLLGIQEADIKNSIEFEWVPFIQELTNAEDIKTALIEVFDMIDRLSKNERKELIDSIKEIPFLPVIREEDTETIIFEQPINSYLNTQNLWNLLKGQNVRFIINEVSEMYYTQYKEIFDELQIKTSFRIDVENKRYEFSFPEKLRNRLKIEFPAKEVSNQKTSYFIDFNISQFDKIVSNLDEHLSEFLWQKLTKVNEIYYQSEYVVRFKNTYDDAKGNFTSTFIEQLNSESWIWINGESFKPSELTHNEFRENYVYRNDNLEKLLNFKTLDDYSMLTESSRQKLQILESRSVDEIAAALSLLDESNRLKRLNDLDDLYLYNILINTLQLVLTDNEVDLVRNISYFNFHNVDNQDAIFNILKSNNVSIEMYNEVSDLAFNKVQYFTQKLVQIKSANEKQWISYMFHKLKQEEKITPKTLFTQSMTNYSQYNFDLDSRENELAVSLDIELFYEQFEFLQFESDTKEVDLAYEYNENLKHFKKMIMDEDLSTSKVDECLNFQSNKSLLFLGVFDELFRRYKTSHLKLGEKKESRYDISQKEFVLKTVNTKKATINHRAVSRTGTKMDIGRTQSGKSLVGFHAEEFCYHCLLQTEGVTNVEWKSENAPIEINANGRAGLGYDISYEKNGKTYFVEVKGTKSTNKKLRLDFSRNEIVFAKLHGEAYQVILVTDMKEKKPNLNVIDNLFIHNTFDFKITTDKFLAEPSGFTVYLQLD